MKAGGVAMPLVSTRAPVRRRLRAGLARTPLYLGLLLVTIVFLFPLLYLLNVALKTPQSYLFDPTGISKSLDLANFSNAWMRGNFAHYFGNTILYTVAATAIGVTSSLLVAFPIARGYVRWSSGWYTLFVISLFLPSGLIPQFQLILHLHLYNTQLGYILLSSGLGLAVHDHRLPASTPRELDEAASIDGCGYLRYNLLMLPPLIKPILVTAALLQAIGVWNDIIGPDHLSLISRLLPSLAGAVHLLRPIRQRLDCARGGRPDRGRALESSCSYSSSATSWKGPPPVRSSEAVAGHG